MAKVEAAGAAAGAAAGLNPWMMGAMLLPGIFDLFSGDPQTKTDYPGSEYSVEAMRRLLQNGGYSPEVMARMKRDARTSIGNETSAARVSAQQRMMRRDIPIQTQEGIMSKITTRGLEALSKAITQVEQGNESQKLQSLRTLAGGRQNVTQTYPGTQGQALGSSIGNISQLYMLQQMLGR